MINKEDWLNANNAAIENKFNELYNTIELRQSDPLDFFRVWESFVDREFNEFLVQEDMKYEE
jgi:hypothetical protein